MKTTLYFRSKAQKAFSIERMFETLLTKMPSDVEPKRVYSKYGGSNPIKCLYNMVEAAGRQGDVNHITGDIYYAAILLKKRKTILTVHDCVNLEKLSGIKREVFRLFWYEIPIRRCGVVTTNSEFTKRAILEVTKCNPDKIVVSHVPIGPEFTAHPKSINVEKPTILMLGSTWNKNQVRQVEALAGIPCIVNLVGRPSEELKAAFAHYNVEHRIEGRLSDAEIVERYVQCDLVMFASLYEGFGMPIVEGNAVGRPVISSTRASMPEVAGDAAALVDPENVEEIRAAVLRILSDETHRNTLIENGYKNHLRFTAEAIAAQYAQIYREMAN